MVSLEVVGFRHLENVEFYIGVRRYRILGGGQGLEYWGEARGGKGGQIPSRHMTS